MKKDYAADCAFICVLLLLFSLQYEASFFNDVLTYCKLINVLEMVCIDAQIWP